MSEQNGNATRKKQLIVNAFVEMCKFYKNGCILEGVKIADQNTGSGHQSPGLWRHPEDRSWRFTDVDHWVELATMLEQANFHGIFIADVLGGYDVYRQSLDPAIISGAQCQFHKILAQLR